MAMYAHQFLYHSLVVHYYHHLWGLALGVMPSCEDMEVDSVGVMLTLPASLEALDSVGMYGVESYMLVWGWYHLDLDHVVFDHPISFSWRTYGSLG